MWLQYVWDAPELPVTCTAVVLLTRSHLCPFPLAWNTLLSPCFHPFEISSIILTLFQRWLFTKAGIDPLQSEYFFGLLWLTTHACPALYDDYVNFCLELDQDTAMSTAMLFGDSCMARHLVDAHLSNKI